MLCWLQYPRLINTRGNWPGWITSDQSVPPGPTVHDTYVLVVVDYIHVCVYVCSLLKEAINRDAYFPTNDETYS